MRGDGLWGGRGDVGASDSGHVSDTGLMRVMQDRQGGGAADVGTGDRGQRDPDSRRPERVLGDALGLWMPSSCHPDRGWFLSWPISNRNAADSGEGMLGIFGTWQAGLLADVDAAPGQAAHEALVPQGPDRGLDRHAADAEEAGQLVTCGQLLARLQLAGEDGCPDAGERSGRWAAVCPPGRWAA